MAQGLGKPASFVLTDELLLRLSHLQRRLLQQTQPRACSSPTVSLLPLNTKRLFARQCGSAGLDQPRDEAGVNHGLITLLADADWRAIRRDVFCQACTKDGACGR